MTKFYVDGTKYTPFSEKNFVQVDKLPGKMFSLAWNDMMQKFYLEEIKEENISQKIYGDTDFKVNRVYTTFMSREKSTGVLLSGEKGSGKTLFSKLLAKKANAEDVPVIVINAPFCGEEFNKFIQSIEQPAIVIFDEFEKVYDDMKQKLLLTVLDGTYTSKKLFVMTCNDVWKIDAHMKNRPGRLFYHIRYNGLSTKFVEDYCKDNLRESQQKQISSICKLPEIIQSFNFDMLKAIVEEINRYEDSLKDVLQLINVDLVSRNDSYTVTSLTYKGKPIRDFDKHVYCNPFVDKVSIDFRAGPNDPGYEATHFYDASRPVCAKESGSDSVEEDSGVEEFEVYFTISNVVSIENQQTKLTFKDDEGFVAVIEKPQQQYNASMLDKLF